MAGVQLYDYQLDAVKKMKNGCILCGGVGSGKSRTALAYYYICNGGEIDTEEYAVMDDVGIKDLYIITTARKRDTKEWEGELSPFLLSTSHEFNLYRNKVIVDSWNNIKKYAEITGAFFIFDEQRVVGSGTWVKSFLQIAKGINGFFFPLLREILGRIIFRSLLQMGFIGIEPSLPESILFTADSANFRKWIDI